MVRVLGRTVRTCAEGLLLREELKSRLPGKILSRESSRGQQATQNAFGQYRVEQWLRNRSIKAKLQLD